MNHRMCCAALGVVLALTTTACDRQSEGDGRETMTAEAPSEPAAEETAETTREQPPATAPSPSDGWRELAESDLSEAQQGQLERATAARLALARGLVERLTSAIQTEGHVAAISVCQSAAPELSAAVSAEMSLRIGRTSHKLRNPGNVTPAWAVPFVQEQAETPRYVAGPDGQLGVLAPIRAAAPCLSCHGSPEELAPGIPEALAEHYAEDQATGFAAGDLRGWFWVEVP